MKFQNISSHGRKSLAASWKKKPNIKHKQTTQRNKWLGWKRSLYYVS